jgi:hypothetical protein
MILLIFRYASTYTLGCKILLDLPRITGSREMRAGMMSPTVDIIINMLSEQLWK